MQHEPRDRHYLDLMTTLSRLALPLLLVGACTATDDLSATEQEAKICPELNCGFNSPVMAFNGFFELAKNGTQNDQGFAIIGFSKNNVSYTLDVSNGELSGTNPSMPRLDHGGLVGSVIWVSLHGADIFAIRVTSVGKMPFSAPPAGDTETYVLDYAGTPTYGEVPRRGWRNVCGGRWNPPDELQSGPAGDLVGMGNAETYGQYAIESVLFDQDRFNMEEKTLNEKPDSGWFNIGCAGHTLSKLYLTRNTIASQGAGYLPLWAERQATLKLLTADYCGQGYSFTVAGQRLDWRGGSAEYFSPPIALEARWDEHGAICLDTPRMTKATTPEGMAEFRNIEESIALHCKKRPEPCADSDMFQLNPGLRVSALR